MKSLIIAILLIFSTTILATPQVDTPQAELSPIEFADFVILNIKRGLSADKSVYAGYLSKTFNHGTVAENMVIAMQYASCSIMWRYIIELTIESEKLDHELLNEAIWRAIVVSKWYVLRIGGRVDQLESAVIPLIASEGVVISESLIYGCTALDVAGFRQLEKNGYLAMPEDDWILEPIPEFKIPSPPSGIAT